MSSRNTSCPRCGGTDRFYLVDKPRNGGEPFWLCNICGHVESENAIQVVAQERPILSAEEIASAHEGYLGYQRWCAEYIWTDAGAEARAYLHKRGFTDETIREFGLGFHPAGYKSVSAPELFYDHRPVYDGAKVGGLTECQGQPKSVLKDTITLPYLHNGTCTMLRSRKLNPEEDGPKYLTPSGVSFYAGGTPTFFLHDVLAATDRVILTEGEFKALSVTQAWKESKLSVPAVGQPGIGYLPDAFMDALKGKTVYMCYDAEARKNPFVLSPGERFTIRNGEKLTGLHLQRRIDGMKRQIKKLKEGENTELIEKCSALQTELDIITARGIVVKAIRLSRLATEAKVDLDSFLIEHGPDALQKLIDQAATFADWYALHGATSYRYEKDGIWSGNERLSNYRAIITGNTVQSDGVETSTLINLVVESPFGERHSYDVADTDWADDRIAKQKLLVATHDGSSHHEGEILKAIKELSSLGDGPTRSLAYTCTGWEQINGRWHYLVQDGSITSRGIDTSHKALVDGLGAHYEMCGPGDAALGAKAYLELMRGNIAPRPLALMSVGHAVMPVLHRFMDDNSRPALFPWGGSGALKTSFVRAGSLALYGPHFTAVRADGAAVAKWDSTSVGLELAAFEYRDVLFPIDDYKQATARPKVLSTFLHAYSESTSRLRGTKDLKNAKSKPARCIAVLTGEDRPTGDAGQIGRVMLCGVRRGDINAEQLTKLQEAGAQGHLAAFFRQFVQWVAGVLDTRGPQAINNLIQKMLNDDDEELGGHRRSAGALRQNRAVFLFFLRWMIAMQYVSQEEASKLSGAHLEARKLISEEQQQVLAEERPSSIFIDIIREGLAIGKVRLEKKGDSEDSLYRGDIIGFETDELICLYQNAAFKFVQEWRRAQGQPLEYTSSAVLQMLDGEGYIAKKAPRRIDCQVRWKDRKPWVIALRKDTFDTPSEEEEAMAQKINSMGLSL